MIRKIVNDIPLYEQFGVFTEAPKRKKKKRIVKGSASTRLTNFTDTIEPEEIINVNNMELDDIDPEDFDDMTQGSDLEELEDDSIQSDDTEEEVPDDMDFTDGIEDEEPEDDNTENEPTEPETGGEQTEQPPEGTEGNTTDTENQGDEANTGENPEQTQPEENQGDTGQAEEQPQDGTGDAELDLGDGGNEDFTNDPNAQPLDPNADPTADPNADPNAQAVDPNAAQPATKDDMRKFVLYKKFMALHTGIDKYTDTIDNIKLDNPNLEYMKNDIVVKFHDIKDLIRDYMIMKYSTDSYVQCTLFYEKMRTAILLLFEKLKVILNNKKQ